MKIGLATTWPDNCGVAEYAQNIIRYCNGNEYKICSTLNDDGIKRDSKDCDLVHLLYNAPVFNVTKGGIQNWDKPTVMTAFHPVDVSQHWGVTRTVVHVSWVREATYIPFGIPDGKVATQEAENMVGTVGFPFGWKGMGLIARAATEAGMKFLAIVPPHPWLYQQECMNQIQQIRECAPDAEIYDTWLDFDKVMELLGRCKVTCFAFQNDNGGGISSSVRYGLGTGRACLLTKDPMYADLWPYSHELTFLEQRPSLTMLIKGLETARDGEQRPKTVLEDMSWSRSADKYNQLYKEIA